jgi:hypothetical protein
MSACLTTALSSLARHRDHSRPISFTSAYGRQSTSAQERSWGHTDRGAPVEIAAALVASPSSTTTVVGHALNRPGAREDTAATREARPETVCAVTCRSQLELTGSVVLTSGRRSLAPRSGQSRTLHIQPQCQQRAPGSTEAACPEPPPALPDLDEMFIYQGHFGSIELVYS